MVATKQCYSCDTHLDDDEQFSEWDMHNVDGGQHPLCWGCSEKMYEYTQDAMVDRQIEDGDYDNDE